MSFKKIIFCLLFLSASFTEALYAEVCGWYTEGDFAPTRRIKVHITNPLDVDCMACPVIIQRDELPVRNIDQRWITVVDPSLPSNPEPTKEQLAKIGGYLTRKETNGHFLEFQQDDLDKDGIWDELFFMADLKANETKTIYLYIEENSRGLFEHKTHAGIGNYGKHIVPFWESQFIGWKLWFPTDVDLHGKRNPMLSAYVEYSRNLSGYYMPYEYGTDIMTVATTFGSGGICLFEYPSNPDSISRPRFTPYSGKGPYFDTRFAFDVVLNGPLRSSIRVKTMNWNSGNGQYEAEQFYTAYAYKIYSICKVAFHKFYPVESSTMLGCGIRQIMQEVDTYQNGGVVASIGKNVRLRDPDQDIGDKGLVVDFEGIALVVKDTFKPIYRNIKGYGGNHVFKIPANNNHTFEYMILAGWSEGTVNKNADEFKNYVINEALQYNNPLEIKIHALEKK